MDVPFQVVLVEPEIPQNTGSVGRLCLATRSILHLVQPLGFEITHSRLRRAGLDYWEHLQVHEHASLPACLDYIGAGPRFFFTKKAPRSLFGSPIPKGSTLVFGRETQGLSEAVLTEYAPNTVALPILDSRVRSLNLATAVGIALYEALRQTQGWSHPPLS